jgi:hypothetical protein
VISPENEVISQDLPFRFAGFTSKNGDFTRKNEKL